MTCMVAFLLTCMVEQILNDMYGGADSDGGFFTLIEMGVGRAQLLECIPVAYQREEQHCWADRH